MPVLCQAQSKIRFCGVQLCSKCLRQMGVLYSTGLPYVLVFKDTRVFTCYPKIINSVPFPSQVCPG
ncbi:unnamed protein product [Gulo gulo]|uniref:Uncharacterized protein n=1 Tax=Gulo gulo TaxID=48420 RepID=A0A9X9M9C0_GULGU|nr:unnamed protein product [Gulo gulo]